MRDLPVARRPDVCSDERNLAWGELRNSLADYQVNCRRQPRGLQRRPARPRGARVLLPRPRRLAARPAGAAELPAPVSPTSTCKLYHAVGNAQKRVAARSRQSLKSTHIYFPLVEQLKAEGRDVELIYFTDVPNRDVRYYQAQADVVCDMLTFGWFGANVREAMMLGKPAVCYLRPAWIENVRARDPRLRRGAAGRERDARDRARTCSWS